MNKNQNDTGDERLPINEAAKRAGLHPNTIRNWRDSGKLPNAAKMIEGKNEIWYVDLAEVEELKRRRKSNKSDNLDTNNANGVSNQSGNYTGNAYSGSDGFNNTNIMALQLARVTEERDRLLSDIVRLEGQLSSLETSRLDYAQAEAELRGRLSGLEKQLDMLEGSNNDLRSQRGSLTRLAVGLIIALVIIVLLALIVVLLLIGLK